MVVAKVASIILKKGREGSLERFHPWLFSGAVGRTEGAPSPGDLVRIQTDAGKIVGFGHYGSGSIVVKMVSFGDTEPTAPFLRELIKSAVRLRASLGLLTSKSTTAFRLVHAEGDGLPGLIVDLLGDVAVLEFHSAGMYRERQFFANTLREELGDRIRGIVFKADENLEVSGTKAATFELGWAADSYKGGERTVLENGHSFIVDVEGGQKTGFFTDQRENRRLVATFARDKTVLDCFTYSGGFASYAAAAGARSITYVDSSKSALDLAKRNLELNTKTVPHEGINADALHYLKQLESKFDLIILDPPAFVKHRGALTGGCKGYESINYMGISKVLPGGIVATFSCSQLVTPDIFRRIVFKSAQKTGRKVRVLAEVRQSPCHPVSLYHPEGEYLKGLVLEVS